MKHYVYRITNTKLNKHYYGTRTSKKNTPEEDLGKYYFSSASNKEFIKDQKENSENYKYKIIKKFRTRKEAIELEIKLHNKFNVGINESFYNRSKQTSKRFDRTGLRPWNFNKINIYTKDTLNKISKNKKLWHSKNEHKPMFGKKHKKETINNMKESRSGEKNSFYGRL